MDDDTDSERSAELGDEDNVDVEVAFTRPFHEIMQRETERKGFETVQELVQNVMWVELSKRFHDRWDGIEVDIDVEVPAECMDEAKLWSAHNEGGIDEFRFNVMQWIPNYIVEDDGDE